MKLIRRKAQRWNVFRTIKIGQATSWKSFFDSKSKISANWLEYYHVGISIQAPYRNTVSVSSSVSTAWKNRESVKALRFTFYIPRLIRTHIAHVGFEEFLLNRFSIDVSYDTKVVVPSSVDVRFNLRVPVTLPADSFWNDEQNPAIKVLSARWNVHNIVNVSSGVSWVDNETLELRRCAGWSVQKLNVRRSAGWDVISPVAVRTKVVYNTRLTLRKNRGTLWNRYKGLWLRRFIRYKAVAKSRTIPTQRVILPPKQTRGALLPNVTMRNIDKKKRHKLGIK